MSVRLFSTPALPSAALQVAVTSLIVSGPVTLNVSDAPMLNQCAADDIWQLVHYMQKTCLTLRQWILNALVGDGALAPDGGDPGSLANVLLTGTLSLSETAGASRVVLTLTDIGSNPDTTLTSITLDNTSGWLTPLGLVEEGASKAFNASGSPAIITIEGDWQPRTMHVFPRSELDTGDRRTKPTRKTIPLKNGDLRQWEIDNTEVKRDYTLVDLGPEHCGAPIPIGRFSAWGATRKAITLKSLAVSPTAFDSMGSYGLVGVGDYVKIGNIEWASRVKTVGTTTVGGVIYLTSLALWEPFPSSVAPSAGDEITVISEAAFLEMEAGRTQHIIFFEQDTATDTPLYGTYGDYALRGDGKTEEGIDQRQPTEAFFSWHFALQKFQINKLTLPT